jgi:hypothetical protein
MLGGGNSTVDFYYSRRVDPVLRTGMFLKDKAQLPKVRVWPGGTVSRAALSETSERQWSVSTEPHTSH